MKKRIFTRLAVFITAFFIGTAVLPVTAPVRVYASEMTEEEQIQFSGQLFTDLLRLIVQQYMGDAVTPAELLDAAVSGMTDTLDPYSYYMNAEQMASFGTSMSGKLTGIGVVIHLNEAGQIEIARVLADSPALEAGLKRGDIIFSVNGTETDGMKPDEVTMIITDKAVTRAEIKVMRGGVEMGFNIEKREIKSSTVVTDRIEEMLGIKNTGAFKDFRYLGVSSIGDATAQDFTQALEAFKKENVRGVVLDMRGNPGGYLHSAIDICRKLVPAGPLFYIVDKQGNQEAVDSELPEAPFPKIIILVDRNTASAAELITAAMQDAKAALVIGETTYGKGVIQSVFDLPNDGGLSLTTEEYLRRSGEKVHEIGVTPDIELTGEDMNPFTYETPEDTALARAAEELLAWK
jgi:carboxyl-terminal processing protease